jgi:hypothetical protein
MIPVNSIAIPDRFVALSARWYDGMGDMLYAVTSTGGLTIGTDCPITHFDNCADKYNKWYLQLWRDLAADLFDAACMCRKQRFECRRFDDWDDCDEYRELERDCDLFDEFVQFVDLTILDLEADYNLEDWENE